MADRGKAKIQRIATGIAGFDSILGGGFPDRSLNIIAGGPGVGKSVLTMQILFHQARRGKKSILFVTISEPAIKFLRYIQQFEFFDGRLFPDKVAFLDLSSQLKVQDLTGCIETIQQEIDNKKPAVIAIDSYRALRDLFDNPASARALIYDLLVNLSVAGVTTFLTGEYDAHETSHMPEFFAADSIIHLSVGQEELRASRRLEVLKLRGSSYAAGVHFFDITSAGFVVYPRVSVPAELEKETRPSGAPRLSTGVSGLDSLLGGGIPARSTTLMQGATGTGKTVLAMNFLAEGARRGEPGLMFTLEETREQLIESFASRGWPLEEWDRQGLLRIVYVSPIELAGDALLQRVQKLIDQIGARRAVVDSLSGLTLCLASENRSPGLVYALVKTFRSKDVTGILTYEIPQLMGTTSLSGEGFSFIVDNMVILRYVEVESRLVQAVAVLKMRGSGYERFLRELKIDSDSVTVGEPLRHLRGVLTGVPTSAESRPGREYGDESGGGTEQKE